MAKANQKGRNKATFIMLRHDMIDSAAYKSLSLAARAVYIEILRRYNSFNNGDIPLSCREAQDLCGISKTTAARAFDMLKNRGFIKIGSDSAFNMKTRQSRRWIITHEKLKQAPPSNEWRKWTPE